MIKISTLVSSVILISVLVLFPLIILFGFFGEMNFPKENVSIEYSWIWRPEKPLLAELAKTVSENINNRNRDVKVILECNLLFNKSIEILIFDAEDEDQSGDLLRFNSAKDALLRKEETSFPEKIFILKKKISLKKRKLKTYQFIAAQKAARDFEKEADKLEKKIKILSRAWHFVNFLDGHKGSRIEIRDQKTRRIRFNFSFWFDEKTGKVKKICRIKIEGKGKDMIKSFPAKGELEKLIRKELAS